LGALQTDPPGPEPELAHAGWSEGGFLQERKEKTFEWFLKIAPCAVIRQQFK
jgi:hypothetical protein